MPKRVAEEVPPRTSCGSRAAASRRLARTDRRRLRRPPITLSRWLPRATQRRAPGAVSVAGEPVVMMMYPLVREMATTTAPHRVPVAVTWSTGLDLCVRPPSGPDMGGVEDGAGDVDEAGVVETVQHGFVEAAPDASSRPDQEPAVGGRLRCAETGRQSVPGAATDQHVDDGREERLVRRVLRPAAPRPHLRRRDQRLRGLPQAVRNNPTSRTPPYAGFNDVSPRKTRSNTATVSVVTVGQVGRWCGYGWGPC